MSQNLQKGQHFLTNPKIIQKEIEISDIKSTDKIIEIGAGEGALTKELAKLSNKILIFEIDKQYKDKLEPIKSKNLTIIYDNAIIFPWINYNKIIANIPYNLSEQILNKSIIEDISSLTLIVGEKFKIILENNKTKSGVLANIFYQINYIKKIDKKEFIPSPRVNSWLIKLTSREQNLKTQLIKSILQKNGKTKNAIIYSLVEQGKTKNEAKEIIKEINLSEKVLDKSVKKITTNTILKLYNF